MSTAMTPVRVEGWTLFTAAGSAWVRDVDLAEQAGLSKPRDIRATISKALTDGALTICGNSAAATGAVLGPLIRVETTLAPKGKGAMQEVQEFYLSQEAALMVIMRLRTKAAVRLQMAIGRVFLLVAQGRAEAAAPPVNAPEIRRAELLVEIVGMMSPAVSPEAKDALLASASAALSGRPVARLLPAMPSGGWRRPAEMAKAIGVSENAIGRAITKLGFRTRDELRRSILDQKKNGSGQVVCFLWSDAVFDALRDHFAGRKRTA